MVRVNVSSHHGPVGSPSFTGQTRLNSATGSFNFMAAASTLNPSLVPPWNLTVGSA